MPSTLRSLTAQLVTPENFRAYRQVISASDDGKPFDGKDAQLRLEESIPRFYIMRLHQRGRRFSQITRHQKCTQCLGALAGQDWLIIVASPSLAEVPDLDAIAAFRIPGDCFIKLEVGTWHAGPYFEQAAIDFYNLELSDTNVTAHQICNLQEIYGVEFELV